MSFSCSTFASKCFLLLLIRLWWIVIFVTFVVCIIWAWSLHVFWSMPCHLYRGVFHVFLWSMWWLAQACKVAFMILLIQGLRILLSPRFDVIFMPCILVATEWCMLVLSIFSKDDLGIWLCFIHPCPCLHLWSALAWLNLALLLL